MLKIYAQGPTQDDWTVITVEGETEADLANVLAASLSRLDLDVRIASGEEYPVRLEYFDWEGEDE